MDNLQLWQRYQDWLYYHQGLGLYVDVSRMRFDDRLSAALKPKFEKAFEEIEALEGGAIANPDEERMVGHYWLRDPDIAPTADIKDEIVNTLKAIDTFVGKVHTGAIKPPQAFKFTDVLSVGIGGSALGPQFVAEALSPDFPPLNVHFIDNTDPAGIDRMLARLKDRLKSTLVIVTSKSSELSAVGLLPAALQGVDIHGMLEGARMMDEATRIRDIKTNPAVLLAMSWYYSGNGKGEKDMVVLPYKDSLLLFSRYLQQLIMESLGKEKDLDGNIVHQGIAVYGNKGSTDQHAYVQQLREGVPNFFATFIEVLEDRQGTSLEVEPGVTSGDYLSGLLQGTRQALYENDRDSVTITIPQVNAVTVGALIALYERTVSLYACLVNINAYHQPGVEAGKKAAASILALQSKVVEAVKSATEPLDLATLANRVGSADQIEAVYKIVRHLAANKRGIKLEGDFSKPASLKVSAA
jgi:glucose-6-phosphate isomerase